MVLTDSAVLALPTGQANTLTRLAAGEVAEVVVARPARVLAALAVVV